MAEPCFAWMRPLNWVSKSLHKLAAELKTLGHSISHETVRSELVKLGFSRQGNRKADEGSRHPDRDAQFAHIWKLRSGKVIEFQQYTDTQQWTRVKGD